MDLSDWITAGLAAYGAVLSTLLGVVALREKRRIVKVSVSWAAPPTPPFRPWIAIKLANPGHKAVTINSVGFFLPDRETRLVAADPIAMKLPYLLQEGASCTALFDPAEVLHALRQRNYRGKVFIYAFCKDAVGNMWKAPRSEINTEMNLES